MKGEWDKMPKQREANGPAQGHNEKYLRVKRGRMDLSDNQHATEVYSVESQPDVDHNKVKWMDIGMRGYAPQAYGYDY